jgi:hypothetical protein
MSNPWEVPDHTNPIGHHVPNPTPQGEPAPLLGGGGDWSTPTPTPAPIVTGGAYPGNWRMGPSRKAMWLAILLAVLLGPFGLFYVSFLNGVAALVVLPVIVQFIVKTLIASRGARIDTILAPLIWGFTVPWAIIATLRHNAKIA